MNFMVDTERDFAAELRAFEYRIGDDETVIEAVLQAVTEATDRQLPSGGSGREPNGGGREQIPPLYDAVDPDALADLSNSATDATVSFSYAERRVTVVGTDAVLVSDASPSSGSGD